MRDEFKGTGNAEYKSTELEPAGEEKTVRRESKEQEMMGWDGMEGWMEGRASSSRW